MGFTDAFSTLEGTAVADFRLPDDPFDTRFLHDAEAHFGGSLKTPNGTESYSVTGGMVQGLLSLDVQFVGSPLARITRAAIKGALSGKGTISGSVEHPTADLSVSLVEGRLGTDNVSLSGQVTLLPDTIRVRGLAIGYLSHALSDGSGVVDFKKGTYSFARALPGRVLQ